jgi:hypothetical protein
VIGTYKRAQKLHTKKTLGPEQTHKELFAGNKPLNIKKMYVYFCPKVAWLFAYGVKITKIEAIENLTLGHL